MNEILFLILGYVSFIAFTCGIMLLGALAEKKIKSDKTICRKLVHIISSLLWIICWFFFGCSIHWVILNAVGALTLGIITFSGKMKNFYGEDVKQSYGVFYFSLSTFIVALICFIIGGEVYLYTGIAYYCLALGDGFAPITAKLLKKHNPEIMPGKSLFGSLTVFVVSFLSTLIFSLAFNMQLDLLFIFSIAALTCIMEFYGTKGIDNILIEFAVFGYLLLYHFGYVTEIVEIVVLVSPFVAGLAIGFKSLSVSGGIFGMILFYLVAFFGEGIVPVLFISILFAVTTVISLVTNRIMAKKNHVNSAKRGRSGKQLFAVGFAAITCLIIYYFTKVELFYMLYFLALTEQFADTMASDIGRLTNGKNIDIIKFKPIEKGLSGGISLLGTSCSLIASVVLLIFPLLLKVIDVRVFLLAAAIAFVGTLIDSILGSLFQALYECTVCGVKTENKIHCETSAKLIKGFGCVGNTTVNLITSFATCSVGCLLLLL